MPDWATALLWSGDVDASVKAFETAGKLGLDLTVVDSFALGIAYLLADRSADAIRTLERSLDRNKTDVYTNVILAAAYAASGPASRCSPASRDGAPIDPRFDIADFGSLFRKAELREKLIAALNKAGL